METKLITVVMPVYNAARFLREAVESVLAQTYSNWELMMIDDCSTDDSLAIAQEYEQMDNRIHVIKAEKNIGVANVRNLGIKAANGHYIALLDSDDIWAADKLEKQVAQLEKTGAKIAYASYDFVDENTEPIKKPFVVPEHTDYKKMLSCNVIGCSTVMADAALLKAHPFRNDFYHEDYVLWMELLKIPVRAVGTRNVLVHYRVVSGSRSNHKGNAAKQRWRIYRDALGLNVVQSTGAFIRYTLNGVMKYYL